MFLARGYHNVSVTDVADALDITPSALYHHFRNKQDLLFEVVWSGLEKVDAALLQCGTLDEAIGRCPRRSCGRPDWPRSGA